MMPALQSVQATLMRRTCLAALALLSFAGAVFAAEGDAAPIPAGLQADVARAEARGAQLFRHDQAAWHSTDALKAAGAFDAPPGEGRGWLTREYAGGIEVRYFAEVDWMPVAFAQANDVSGKAEAARRLQPPEPATVDERRLLKARDLAAARAGLRCSGAVNTVVLPGADSIDVYVMSAWEGGPFVLGGHQRVRVSTDGERVLDAYEHTRGCVAGDGPPEGYEPIPVTMVSHLTSPTPNEFHVFLSLQHALEIYVLTTDNKLLWSVKDGKIRLVPREEAKS